LVSVIVFIIGKCFLVCDSSFERLSVFLKFILSFGCIFFVDYVLPIYSGKDLGGRFTYSTRFSPLVDLLSVAPYWIDIVFSAQMLTSSADNSIMSTNVCYCQLPSPCKARKYTTAFTIFDDVIRDNVDILGVTAFSSVLLWILFSAILYYTERDNPNGEKDKFLQG